MPALDRFFHPLAQYLLALTIIALLVVCECEIGVNLLASPQDCIAILLDR